MCVCACRGPDSRASWTLKEVNFQSWALCSFGCHKLPQTMN